MTNLESETQTTSESKKRLTLERLEVVLTGGLIFGLTGAISGNLIDNEIIAKVGYGLLIGDAALFAFYRYKKYQYKRK